MMMILARTSLASELRRYTFLQKYVSINLPTVPAPPASRLSVKSAVTFLTRHPLDVAGCPPVLLSGWIR